MSPQHAPALHGQYPLGPFHEAACRTQVARLRRCSVWLLPARMAKQPPIWRPLRPGGSRRQSPQWPQHPMLVSSHRRDHEGNDRFPRVPPEGKPGMVRELFEGTAVCYDLTNDLMYLPRRSMPVTDKPASLRAKLTGGVLRRPSRCTTTQSMRRPLRASLRPRRTVPTSGSSGIAVFLIRQSSRSARFWRSPSTLYSASIWKIQTLISKKAQEIYVFDFSLFTHKRYVWVLICITMPRIFGRNYKPMLSSLNSMSNNKWICLSNSFLSLWNLMLCHQFFYHLLNVSIILAKEFWVIFTPMCKFSRILFAAFHFHSNLPRRLKAPFSN